MPVLMNGRVLTLRGGRGCVEAGQELVSRNGLFERLSAAGVGSAIMVVCSGGEREVGAGAFLG
jgi:hypothetical protein